MNFDLSIDGMSTHLTATPLQVTWHFSDGRVWTGVPANVDEANAQVPIGRTDIEFENSGNYQVTAAVDWNVVWITSEGETGKVDGRQSSATVDYRVGERRSVLIDGY